ncbi:hypothetical protein E5981_06145 [Bacteroides faecichinchillae]|nr:hypothetical protein E5981_06145 [Bacteroides faecichinchillae]
MLISKKSVHLQCVFHSIRFKVNKGWSTAVLLFYIRSFVTLKKNGIFVNHILKTKCHKKNNHCPHHRNHHQPTFLLF